MKTFLIGVIVALSGGAWAADLNAPAVKAPTIGSELTRGSNVAKDCYIRTISDIWPIFARCIDEAEQAENRKNTDTDAFLLGLHTVALVRFAAFDRKVGNETVVSTGRESAQRVTSLQNKLGIADVQLAEFFDAPLAELITMKKRWVDAPPRRAP